MTWISSASLQELGIEDPGKGARGAGRRQQPRSAALGANELV